MTVLDLEEYRAKLLPPIAATIPRAEAELAVRLAYARGLRDAQTMGVRRALERAEELES